MALPDSPAIRVEGAAVRCGGSWTIDRVAGLHRRLRRLEWPADAAVEVDASGVVAMDTAGALLLERTARGLERSGRKVTLRLRPHDEALLAIVTSSAVAPRPQARPRTRLLSTVGLRARDATREVFAFVHFLGEICVTAVRARSGPLPLRARQVLQHVQAAGLEALPAAALLSFFVGVVLAYQVSALFRPLGAGILVADLVGVAMVRELAPLLTALLVAGRSGSAYAAELGAMQLAGELDSLRAAGVSPVAALVLPRVAALAVVLPLLTVAADVVGVAGAMLVTGSELAIAPGEFLDRVARQVRVSDYLLGLAKAPVFGAIIASVGCHQGLRAAGDVASVGRRTTLAVVQSMFLVVVADGFFFLVARALGM